MKDQTSSRKHKNKYLFSDLIKIQPQNVIVFGERYIYLYGQFLIALLLRIVEENRIKIDQIGHIYVTLLWRHWTQAYMILQNYL